MTKSAIQEAPEQNLVDLKEMTDARVALGRFGAGLPTRAAQAFLLDHARAREAVWSMVDRKELADRLSRLGFSSVEVESRAGDRSTYVRRPDLGRQLSDASLDRLKVLATDAGKPDIAIVVADGLSSSAVDTNAVRLIEELGARFGAKGLKIGPVVLAEQARVALGDPAAEALGARLSIVLVGERPGLSAADSLGAYITYAPQSGTPDSRRNCVSNIRDGGLSIGEAADMIADLVTDIFRTAVSGVALKDALVQLAG